MYTRKLLVIEVETHQIRVSIATMMDKLVPEINCELDINFKVNRHAGKDTISVRKGTRKNVSSNAAKMEHLYVMNLQKI